MKKFAAHSLFFIFTCSIGIYSFCAEAEIKKLEPVGKKTTPQILTPEGENFLASLTTALESLQETHSRHAFTLPLELLHLIAELQDGELSDDDDGNNFDVVGSMIGDYAAYDWNQHRVPKASN